MTRFSGEVWFHQSRYTHACCRKSQSHSRGFRRQWGVWCALSRTRVTGPNGSRHRRLPRHFPPTVWESDEWLGVAVRDTKLMTGAYVNKIYNIQTGASEHIHLRMHRALFLCVTFKPFRFHECNYILILWFNLQLWYVRIFTFQEGWTTQSVQQLDEGIGVLLLAGTEIFIFSTATGRARVLTQPCIKWVPRAPFWKGGC
jgi:hypothetical protein